MTVVLSIPGELMGRGIAPPGLPRDFRISLDAAEPWGGGTISGRVERMSDARSPRPLAVTVACQAAWIDIAPQLVGQGPKFSVGMFYELRQRRRGIWLDETLHEQRVEVEPLAEANWQRFAFTLPSDLPRAFEGTFCAFRYTVSATRRRTVGSTLAIVPVIIDEQRDEPIIRIETTPIGTWRLIEWRAADEVAAAHGSVAVEYAARKSDDLPRPGETRDEELLRRVGAAASPR